MTRADALRLGPFVGGLNTGSDPTAVADSELVDCVNFELDIDGSLVQRPPIVEVANNAIDGATFIGSAVINNVSYLVLSSSAGTYLYDGTNYTTIKAGLESRKALQYRDKIYIIATPSSAQAGGYYNVGTALWTTDASMPRGGSAVFSKSRLFVVPGEDAVTNASRLTFTDPITSDTLSWSGTNIIDVSPGDGQNLVDLLVYNDNLILFKNDSTYVLAYDLQPSDAILRNINTTIGTTARYCTVVYENSIFIYHEGKVYEMINYDFNQINIKVPFLFDGTVPSGSRINPVFLSLLGDRLVVRYYNRIYIYGLKTKTWTRWESTSDVLQNFGPLIPFPSNPTQFINTKYYASVAISNYHNVIYIPDGWDSITKESTIGLGNLDISSRITTKNYDLADSHHYKKMMWWGADILTNQDVVGKAQAVTINFQVTWLDLSTKLWGDLTTSLWATPLSNPIIVETNIDITSKANRKFVKFKKTMRFREINYEVELKGDGSTATGPCRLFTLTAIIGSKETVSKQVS